MKLSSGFRLVAGVCLTTFVSSASAAEKINWTKTLDGAVKEAKTSGKLVMADFYTDWCGWCTKLDKDVYANEKFAKLATELFVSVKVNAESESGGKADAQKYKVSDYPTILFIDGDGKVVGRISGYMTADAFGKKAGAVAQSHKEMPGLLAKVKAAPADSGAVSKLAAFYAESGEVKEAKELLSKAEAANADKKVLAKAYNAVGDALLSSRDVEGATSIFRTAADKGDGAEKAHASAKLALLMLMNNKLEEGRAALEKAAAIEGISAEDKSEARQLIARVDQIVNQKRLAEEKRKAAEKLIPWAKSLEAALSTAKETNKVVMVDFYTDWCGWCKKLDADVYADAKAAKIIAGNVVALKLNAEGNEGAPHARKYKVNGFPTILFLDGDGRVMGRIGGYLAAEPFTAKVLEIAKSAKEMPALLTALKDKPYDLETVNKLALIFASQGDGERARNILRVAEEKVADKIALAKTYNAVADSFQEAQSFDQAVPLFRKAAELGDARAKVYALSSIGFCMMSERKFAEALVEAEKALAIADAPEDVRKDAKALKSQVQQILDRQKEATKKTPKKDAADDEK